jgi:hypothetical protein
MVTGRRPGVDHCHDGEADVLVSRITDHLHLVLGANFHLPTLTKEVRQLHQARTVGGDNVARDVDVEGRYGHRNLNRQTALANPLPSCPAFLVVYPRCRSLRAKLRHAP